MLMSALYQQADWLGGRGENEPIGQWNAPRLPNCDFLIYLVAIGCIACQYKTKIQNKGDNMPTAVKISDELIAKAKVRSKVFKRSVAGQIEYWAKIGQIIEENPELPLPFIQDVLIGKEEIKSGLGTPYVFGE